MALRSGNIPPETPERCHEGNALARHVLEMQNESLAVFVASACYTGIVLCVVYVLIESRVSLFNSVLLVAASYATTCYIVYMTFEYALCRDYGCLQRQPLENINDGRSNACLFMRACVIMSLCVYLLFGSIYCNSMSSRMMSRGIHKCDVGRYDEALELFRSANTYSEIIIRGRHDSHRQHRVETMLMIGYAQLKTNNIDTAIETLRNVLRKTDGGGRTYRWQATRAQRLLGDCNIAKGDYATALHLYNQSMQDADESDTVYKDTSTYAVLWSLFLKTGNPAQAIEHYKTALEMSQDQRNLSDQASILALLGNAYMAQGDTRLSRKAYLDAKNRFEQLGDSKRAAYLQHVMRGNGTMDVTF